MARFALSLALWVAALNFLYPKACELLGRPAVPFVDLVLYLPAILMGAWHWCKGRSFASSWPVVFCVALVWMGLLYAGNSQSDRGVLIAALLTIVLPVTALIVQKRAWLACARTYVIANATALGLALWMESLGNTVRAYNMFFRFGYLMAKDGYTPMANPNQVGGQLALASVLALILYLNALSRTSRRGGPRGRTAEVFLGLTVFLSLGCLLTASRGAAASWLVGMAALFIWGTKSQRKAQLRDLVFLASMGTLALIFVLVAGQRSPLEKLQSRLGTTSLSSLGHRTTIWLHAWEAWHSDPDFLFRGAGTGMADEVLGQFDEQAREDDYGVLRLNCHNAFVEWGLSFGIVGMICGGCLLATMFHKMRLLDGGDRNVGRHAVLACVMVFAMTAVLYRHPCWMATGSLVLAMLSGTPRKRRRHRDRPAAQGSAQRSTPTTVSDTQAAPHWQAGAAHKETQPPCSSGRALTYQPARRDPVADGRDAKGKVS